MKRLRIFSIIGFLIGGLAYLAAGWWAAQTATDQSIVGANIGAGLLGLAGLAIAVICLILFGVSFIKRKR